MKGCVDGDGVKEYYTVPVAVIRTGYSIFSDRIDVYW